MTIGRAADCTVVVPDLEMARQHAVFEQKDVELFIRDLGSMNRILVNKREVRETRLKHGDELELGRTRLVVQALVQAEVEGSSTRRRRRYHAAWAVAATLLIGVVLALSARYVPHDTPTATEPAPSSAPTQAHAKASSRDDLKGLREDILAIQEKVKTLATRPTPSNPPAAAAASPPAPTPGAKATPAPTPAQDAAALLEAARAAHAAGKLPEAEALLDRAQQLDPDLLAAYEERAAVLEKMGRRGEAAGLWSEVLRRSTESPLYQRAVAERIRLSESAHRAADADTPALAIASVQHTRFPASAEYDEMRVLNVALAPRQPGVRLDRAAVEVEIQFYDHDTLTGEARPTEAQVVQEVAPPTPAWGREAEQLLSATYLAPRGLRARQMAENRPSAYHGYRVRVFYHGHLQDECAAPKTLAGLPAPERPHAAPP